MEKNLLPFDWEIAQKQPERVVTRDGRKVTQLTKFEGVIYPIVGVLGNNLYHWYSDGRIHKGVDVDNDLFLLPEIKECWVNVYQFKSTGGFHLLTFDTEEYSQINRNDDPYLTYIKTIRITNEPETL